MWKEINFKSCWNWTQPQQLPSGGLDNLFEEIDSPLWSPTSTSISSSNSSSITSSSVSDWNSTPTSSPDAFSSITPLSSHPGSYGRFFNFGEDELVPPQGAQNSLLGEDFWANVEQLRQQETTKNLVSPFGLTNGNTGIDNNHGDGEVETEVKLKPCHNPTNEIKELDIGVLDSEDDEEMEMDKGQPFSRDAIQKPVRCMWIDCKTLFDTQVRIGSIAFLT